MEELDLKELISIFWNKKIQIILIILIFIALGVIYSVGFVIPMYTSSTTLVLATSLENSANSSDASTETITTTDLTLNSKLVSTYSELVKSKNVLRQVISTYASKVANEIAKVFTDKVKEIYNINNVHVVDEAETANAPSNINHTRDVIMFALIGCVVAIAYALISNMLDTTIKTAEDIEKSFGVPVLASIPMIENFENERGGKRK